MLATTDSAQLGESWINLTDVSEGFGAITPDQTAYADRMLWNFARTESVADLMLWNVVRCEESECAMESKDSQNWLDDGEKYALLGISIKYEEHAVKTGPLTPQLAVLTRTAFKNAGALAGVARDYSRRRGRGLRPFHLE